MQVGRGKLKAWLPGSGTGWGICRGLQLRPNTQRLVTEGRKNKQFNSLRLYILYFRDVFNSCFCLMRRPFHWVEWFRVGNATFLPPLCSPMVYTRAALQGRCPSHECVLTRFKLTLGRETQRGLAWATDVWPRSLHLPVSWEGQRHVVMPGSWIKPRALDKTLGSSCPCPCLPF